MLNKRPKSSQSEKTIFQSRHKGLPTISIQLPNLVTDFYSHNKSDRKDVIEGLGLLNTCSTPFLTPNLSSQFRSSKISMSDIMGEKNCKRVLRMKKLGSLWKKLDSKAKNDQDLQKRSLFRPASPNVMDQNMMLRVKMSELKSSGRKSSRSNSRSHSPCGNGKRMVYVMSLSKLGY